MMNNVFIMFFLFVKYVYKREDFGVYNFYLKNLEEEKCMDKYFVSIVWIMEFKVYNLEFENLYKILNNFW